MIAVSSVMMSLTLIFISIRLYTSLYINRLPGIEDCKLSKLGLTDQSDRKRQSTKTFAGLCMLAVILAFAYVGVILECTYSQSYPNNHGENGKVVKTEN